jgi:hypothetical protein
MNKHSTVLVGVPAGCVKPIQAQVASPRGFGVCRILRLIPSVWTTFGSMPVRTAWRPTKGECLMARATPIDVPKGQRRRHAQ